LHLQPTSMPPSARRAKYLACDANRPTATRFGSAGHSLMAGWDFGGPQSNRSISPVRTSLTPAVDKSSLETGPYRVMTGCPPAFDGAFRGLPPPVFARQAVPSPGVGGRTTRAFSGDKPNPSLFPVQPETGAQRFRATRSDSVQQCPEFARPQRQFVERGLATPRRSRSSTPAFPERAGVAG